MNFVNKIRDYIKKDVNTRLEEPTVADLVTNKKETKEKIKNYFKEIKNKFKKTVKKM